MSLAATTRSTLFRATKASSIRALGSITAVKTKYTLPDLPYDYGALEPHISGQIMEVHHKKHHQTYVNGINDAQEKFGAASSPAEKVALTSLIKFHGGGHVNHSLFWENLSPTSKDGGAPPTGSLASAIDDTWGSLDEFKGKMNAALAGIQGSGWGWLVKDNTTQKLSIVTMPNQDPINTTQYTPLVGIDAWEHAYYLQYQNVKADYFKAIWNVINWKTAEKRFS
ncbi:Superoxide dismutase [Mn], mitochondrial [Orbilia ellipsospora]|uniref:Superoxide dismutase n=1 Tax=Orbilia ellipsospora TaxID=2528407 RepID=A0AAV9X8M6_9PEZI